MDEFAIAEGELAVMHTSPEVERGFCSRCATTLTYRHALRASEFDFTLVSLDEPGAVVPRCHIWVQDKLPWLTIADDLPQYATVPMAP